MPKRESMTDRDSSRAAADEPGDGLPDPLSQLGQRPGLIDLGSEPDADLEPVIGSPEPAAITVGAAEGPPVFGAGSLGVGTGSVRIGDRVMLGLTASAGAFVVGLIALIAIFLLIRAIPAISGDHSNFLFSRDWDVDGATLKFGVLPLLWTTVLISLVAMVIAVPVAIGIALFITHYAPKRLAKPVAYVVDLLAAIPSIIYGIWGITELAPKIQPFANLISRHLGGFPLFADKNVQYGTVFTGGVVLAVMILPIVTAVSRDVFERTPRANIEAAWALGATKWEMIRLSVLPYGRPGLVSGAMLGLGRALGETIAISLILSKVSNSGPFSWSIFDGGETFASKIANSSSEFNTPKQTGAFIAAGLVLFVLTFAVNAAARAIVNRRKEFS